MPQDVEGECAKRNRKRRKPIEQPLAEAFHWGKLYRGFLFGGELQMRITAKKRRLRRRQENQVGLASGKERIQYRNKYEFL
jgi:hypothetical protein